MNLKTSRIASMVIMFSSTPMFARQQAPPTSGPKSLQQSKVVAVPIPLEIKGDYIGETVEQFTTHYPDATCKNKTANVRVCTQPRGDSLADVHTDDSACDHHSYACQRQGVQARFNKGHLESIVYRFYGLDDYMTFCDAFAAKYGKPTHDLDKDKEGLGCLWEQGESSLHAWGGKVANHELQVAVIMLAGSTPSKDI